MRVAGFTFIRNAIKFDYPIEEAIRSILPVCEKVVVAVGESEDATLELIQRIDSERIVILKTRWDESLKDGGRVLASETDKAFQAIGPGFDWAFYIQGDEVFHENGLDSLFTTMQKWQHDKSVEGLLFDWRHFYGSYDFIGDSRRWYRREVRVVRPSAAICSWKDAQGFRKTTGEKLRVKPVPDAWIHHYGWVKPPATQQLKALTFNRLWHDEAWMRANIPPVSEFDYAKIESLERFTGSHPAVMQKRIAAMNWQFSFDPTIKNWTAKERLSRLLERTTGWRPGEYKNYRLI